MDNLPESPPPAPKKSLKMTAGHVLTIVAALIAVRITMSVPGFAHNFEEAPFNPPAFSLLVVHCYPILLAISSVTVLGAIYTAWRYRSVAPPAWVPIIFTLAIGAQVLVVGVAMLVPALEFIHQHLNN